MIDSIAIDSAIRITTIITIAIWMRTLNMSYTLKDFFSTKLKATYTAKTAVERNRKKRKEDRIVNFKISTIIYSWRIAEECAVTNRVTEFNHPLFSDSFQIRI